ncbi:MAG: hypothetical protein DMF45_04000 [Verrucomicrobia bacterium]|nr:MAG: hypothetical protein DMF45_04000 [Verrucomicrobiota bacterium]
MRGVQSTAAILLRKRKFSDTSLIVSWCTESLGCVQTVAKGARRIKTPFAGKLDLFFEAEISVVTSRKSTLHTLTEVVLKNPFAGIRQNYLRTQAAADSKKLKADPAFALGNLFGRLPLSRTPLLKTLTSEAKSKAKETA